MPRSSSSVARVVRERRERAVGHGRTVAPGVWRLSAKCPLPEGSLVREPTGAIADDDGDVRNGRSSTREGTTMNTSTKLARCRHRLDHRLGTGTRGRFGRPGTSCPGLPGQRFRIAVRLRRHRVVGRIRRRRTRGRRAAAVERPHRSPRTTRTTARSPSNGRERPQGPPELRPDHRRAGAHRHQGPPQTTAHSDTTCRLSPVPHTMTPAAGDRSSTSSTWPHCSLRREVALLGPSIG